jgi:hypothetical protein
VGSLRDCTWILGLTEYRLVELEREDDGRFVIEIDNEGFGATCAQVVGDAPVVELVLIPTGLEETLI